LLGLLLGLRAPRLHAAPLAEVKPFEWAVQRPDAALAQM